MKDIVDSRNFVAGLPFVDPSRIFIMGGSWGGTLTGLILTSPYGSLFQGGVSMAGVMDWAKQLKRTAFYEGEDVAQGWMQRLGMQEDPRKRVAINTSFSPALRLKDLSAPWLVFAWYCRFCRTQRAG